MEEHIQNSYAQDKDGKPLYIEDVESGAKGYYCMGCKKPMQAVKRKVYRSYFRHDVKDVKRKNRCTYRDQDHRHRLAQEHLLIEKRIKVPTVIKFSLADNDPPMLISNSQWYESNVVKRELVVFEDENGDVKWGSGHKVEEKNLLIRADVAFFLDGKPDLLIELVASHKLSEEKKAKLRRLGINTIQIKVPKDSPENIIYALNTTTNTKWIYNRDEATTEYIRPSRRNSEQSIEIDEQQRRFFEETYACRAAEIGNLIRGIRRCYESKQYREIESRIGGDLRRTKGNAERTGIELQKLQAQIEDDIKYEFGKEQERFDSERKIVEGKYAELEERYFSKKEELGIEEESLDIQIQEDYQLEGKSEFDFETRASEIREESERLDGNIRRAEQELSIVRSEQEGLESNIRKEFQERVRRIEESIEGEEGNIKKFGERIDQLRQYISGKVNREGDTEIQKYTNRIQRFYDNRGLLAIYSENRYVYERIRDCREAIRSGTYKTWY
ncbi:MAG: hypothetical protein WDZ35_13425 [Crocinitomicaceae bacterium]